ncbi:MAG TPA: 2-hydroxyacyl-CoA dehydratase [Gemmatimonadales bacterium]|nr:2-hydroxyacyl-CoA dehydratase [Gemmatimonadales bacterium]
MSAANVERIAEPLFAEWRGQPLSEILSRCRELVEDAEFPTVKRWRDGGGKVVGHFQVYFPEEIAHAAGLLPFKVRGAPVEPTQADSRFGSYLCSIIKTSLELALAGRVDLDLFVTHPICDAARNLAAVWGRNVSYPCRILYLPQNPNSGAAVRYLRDEYDRLRRALEDVAGRSVTDDDLRRSIVVFNENRGLLRRLYALKRDRPWLVAADEAYVLVALGGLIPREEHNDLLRAVLPLLEGRSAPRHDKIRVILEGGFCEQPPLDLLRAIARSCYVVDDDLLIGMRWITDDVPVSGDPLLGLARAYVDHSAHSPVQHDLRKPKDRMLLERLDVARAQAAILMSAKMCEPGLEELVVHTRALDQRGIPYFVSEFEENMTSFDQLEIQLETFVENLLFD